MTSGFPLEAEDKAAIRTFWEYYQVRHGELIAALHRRFAAGSPEIREELAQTVALEEAQRGFALQAHAALDGDWDEYLAWLHAQGAIYANAGVGPTAWMWRAAALRDAVRDAVVRELGSLPAATTIIDGVLRLIDVTLDHVLNGFVAAKEHEFAQSEDRYRALFEQSPLPMWTFDRETLRFVHVNEAAIRAYGYSRDEFLAMRLTDIRPSEDVARLVGQLEAGVAPDHTKELWRHRTKDGTILTVEVRATDFDVGGRPVRLVLINDVTGRERAQQALRDAEAQLRQAQKMDALGRMAGGIAHDFNNVLTVVAGYAALLEDGLEVADVRREDASEIRRAAERAGELTRQLLAMGRHSIVTPRPIAIDDVIAGFTAILRRALGEQVALVVHRGNVPLVLGDEGQLEQVLLNLALNGRDAMPDGGRLTIETEEVHVEDGDPRGLRPGRHVCLAVTDTGTGMDAETQRRIFDPFFTTKGPGRGTGLGLAIVHGIVTQAEGTISVYSQPGRGTAFRIHLPVTGATPEARPASVVEAPVRLPPVTVLIADADRGVREVAVRILRDAGCHVLEAAGAEEARHVCVSHDGALEVVVLDLALADTAFEQLVRQLRELRPSLAVVPVSGYPAGALGEHGAAPPDLLAKPYTPAGLRRAVARALGTTARPRVATLAGATGTSVLVVDDEAGLRRAIGRSLRGEGCAVVEVESGDAAMKELESRRFDVILSDVYMPGMLGMDLLRAVRRVDLDVPVILMSGSPSVDAAQQAIEYGAFRYLTKPLDLVALTRAVQHAARAHTLARLRRDAFSLRGTPAGAVDRAGLEVRFDQAIDGLWMAFQPLVAARDGALFGVEALVRSSEPSMSGPMQLLDAATQLGQLTRLGRRVRALSAAPVTARTDGLNLFVNLHPEDLLDADLVDEASPLAQIASRVILEVTERASLSSSPVLVARLARLRELGFRLAVDDIGAGYSGLTSFTELTPEIVKIDMSLVRDVHVNALKQRTIGALCRLCHEVGTQVVGEGVETTEERDCLVDLGCDLLQGYLIARPGRDLP